MSICLLAARNRVKQAEAVLGVWLESPRDDYECSLISSVITLLEGVEEAINEADIKLNSLKK
ncbi:hypothetical protein [Pseudescherichia sp.]|uniref:hypothetical protein n=1 Tax=Pseudescherichia sp. TaxID=2055881 RepID=UPI0028A100C6|nr:hypothetical protein [Pseudescherichia sp.]